MPIIESLACGTRVIAIENGPFEELGSTYDEVFFFRDEDVDSFISTIHMIRLQNKNAPQHHQSFLSDETQHLFSAENIAQQYIQFVKDATEDYYARNIS